MCVGKPPASVRHDRSCQKIPKIDGMRFAEVRLRTGSREGVTNRRSPRCYLSALKFLHSINKHFWQAPSCRGAACQAYRPKRASMGALNPPNDQGEFTIHFRSTAPIRTLTFKDRLGLGGIAFVRGSSHPIEGLRVRSSQGTGGIHESETFRMDWRSADSDRLRSSEIACGYAHVGDGKLP